VQSYVKNVWYSSFTANKKRFQEFAIYKSILYISFSFFFCKTTNVVKFFLEETEIVKLEIVQNMKSKKTFQELYNPGVAPAQNECGGGTKNI